MSTLSTDLLLGLHGGIAYKAPVRVATTAAITLSGLQTIDGIALATGDRVLVKDQSNGVQNGIYVADTSSWARAKDFDSTYDVRRGTQVLVTEGVNGTNGTGIWILSSADPITIGTTSLTFLAQAYTAVLIRVANGTDAAPAVAFTDDTDTGIYSPEDGQLAISADGNQVVKFFDGGMAIPDGAFGTPSLCFLDDPNTGLYSPAPDAVGISAGGSPKIISSATGNKTIGPDQTTAAVVTGTGTSIEANSNLVGSYSGGGIIFSAGDSKFAAIKGGVTDATANSVGILSFCTRVGTADAALTEHWRISPSGAMQNVSNKQPSFHASANASVTSGNTIIFDTENHDYGGVYNTSTGIFTAPVAGVYMFCATVEVFNNTGFDYTGTSFSIRADGVTIAWEEMENCPNGVTRAKSMSVLIYLAANATVYVYSSTSFSGTFYTTSGNYCRFSGRLLG